MIDLTRPARCPDEWHAVIAIGFPPDGIWTIYVVQQPAADLSRIREFSPAAAPIALRWLPSAAFAHGFAAHMEKIILPPARGIGMRGMSFMMPQEKLKNLFLDTARVLRAPELDLEEFA